MAKSVTAKHALVGLAIRVELNSSNGLRRVIFTLAKDVLPKNKVQFQINFQLFERKVKSDEFVKLIDVDVNVKTQNNKGAEAVHKRKGLTARQSSHAIGPAAELQKAANTGEVPQEDADESVEETVTK